MDTVGWNRPARHAGQMDRSATWAYLASDILGNVGHHSYGAAIRCLPLLPGDGRWIHHVGVAFFGLSGWLRSVRLDRVIKESTTFLSSLINKKGK
jgi:hypothetical protein